MRRTNLKINVLSNIKDSPDTHTTKWFKDIWAHVISMGLGKMMVDPFARNCQHCRPHTNDLNPNTDANSHVCALEFLRTFKNDKVDLVVFDPPFSERRCKEHYEGYGVNLYASDSKLIDDCLEETSRILRAGGCLLKFGYNMNKPAPGFSLLSGWIINKNGNANSTLVSLWVNESNSLSKWS